MSLDLLFIQSVFFLRSLNFISSLITKGDGGGISTIFISFARMVVISNFLCLKKSSVPDIRKKTEVNIIAKA